MNTVAPIPTATQLAAEVDLSSITRPTDSAFLKSVQQRAQARMHRFKPITVEERFEGFKLLNFRPHGLYVPDNDRLRAQLQAHSQALGALAEVDKRLSEYGRLQDACARLEAKGVAGRWIGQQQVARSNARFRLVAWGRRGGKTFLASREAVAVALIRPRASVWLAAPTSRHVSRCFDMVIEVLADMGIRPVVTRNSKDDKLIILDNGSRIEGVSLDNPKSAAGASVDYAVVDEAAQVSPDAWFRGILPPLADRNGQALLISSWEGEDEFFYQQAQKAKDGNEQGWEVFVDASWEVNFYAFPQGRQTPILQEYERTMPAQDFLEQFGAIPTRARNLIFPQFRKNIHVTPCPYVPGVPVYLAVDPSGGANAYAVLAIQEYDGKIRVFDEFYISGALAEDAAAWADRKPWRGDVRQGVIDSAVPTEMLRWIKLGFPMIPVPNKPRAEERFPYYRKLLRDPVRYHRLYIRRRSELLEQMGIDPNEHDFLSTVEQNKIAMELEEKLSDVNISRRDQDELRECATIIFDPVCYSTIQEHSTYIYRQPRINQTDLLEAPKKFHDHALDALGYWVWTFKRYDMKPSDNPNHNYLKVAGRAEGPPVYDVPEPEIDEDTGEKVPRGQLSFLQVMRQTFVVPPRKSYLRKVD